MAEASEGIEVRIPFVESLRAKNWHEPELCYLASEAVGWPVLMYQEGDGRLARWQVMRATDAEGPGYAFWRWHVWEVRQFYPTPAEAAAAFVASWRGWQAKGGASH